MQHGNQQAGEKLSKETRQRRRNTQKDGMLKDTAFQNAFPMSPLRQTLPANASSSTVNTDSVKRHKKEVLICRLYRPDIPSITSLTTTTTSSITMTLLCLGQKTNSSNQTMALRKTTGDL